MAVARLVTQRSPAPDPPGRSEVKYSDSPSREMLGPPSKAELLTTGPRLVGRPKIVTPNSERTCAGMGSIGIANAAMRRSLGRMSV